MIYPSAPVLLITFNRPDTTRKVFDAIRKAKPSKLYIFNDGPREGNDEDKKDSTEAGILQSCYYIDKAIKENGFEFLTRKKGVKKMSEEKCIVKDGEVTVSGKPEDVAKFFKLLSAKDKSEYERLLVECGGGAR